MAGKRKICSKISYNEEKRIWLETGLKLSYDEGVTPDSEDGRTALLFPDSCDHLPYSELLSESTQKFECSDVESRIKVEFEHLRIRSGADAFLKWHGLINSAG
ncbi:hypothetical protein AKJ16_DCAP05133 [Drosera capensis]